MNLSILCISKGEPHSAEFLRRHLKLSLALQAELVVVADGPEAEDNLSSAGMVPTLVSQSKGYLESLLDEGVAECEGPYILRLDDDETCSPEMVIWLAQNQYATQEHWKFSRAHLWKNEGQYITNPPLWPDHQTRLSLKKQSGNRPFVHSESPYGGGELAPVTLFHHKFLVKSYEVRKILAAHYDALHPGYGTGYFLPFNLPEDAFPDLSLQPVYRLRREA